jgi:hypothetical protein
MEISESLVTNHREMEWFPDPFQAIFSLPDLRLMFSQTSFVTAEAIPAPFWRICESDDP